MTALVMSLRFFRRHASHIPAEDKFSISLFLLCPPSSRSLLPLSFPLFLSIFLCSSFSLNGALSPLLASSLALSLLLSFFDCKIYQDQPLNSNDRDDLLIFCKISHFISSIDRLENVRFLAPTLSSVNAALLLWLLIRRNSKISETEITNTTTTKIGVNEFSNDCQFTCTWLTESKSALHQQHTKKLLFIAQDYLLILAIFSV